MVTSSRIVCIIPSIYPTVNENRKRPQNVARYMKMKYVMINSSSMDLWMRLIKKLRDSEEVLGIVKIAKSANLSTKKYVK